MVLSILHGGNGLPFLAPPVYKYLVTGSYDSISVSASEIPESTMKFVVEKVRMLTRTGV